MPHVQQSDYLREQGWKPQDKRCWTPAPVLRMEDVPLRPWVTAIRFEGNRYVFEFEDMP